MKLHRIGLLLLLAALGAAAGAAWWLHAPLSLNADEVQIVIPSGSSAREVARAVAAAGVESSPLFMSQWFRWSGQERKIRPGTYQIDRSFTPVTLLEALVLGEQSLATVRLIEGWTFHRFRAELAMAEGLAPSTAMMRDEEIMERLGAPGVAPEGRFFPDTYSYSPGTKDFAILEQAYRAMKSRLESAWVGRASDTPLRSADEALILASIVEKETGATAERSLIAAVFVNRLRAGMPLQTDPTVIYGLGNRFDGNLRRRDLLSDTPFNTYTRGGLPPTPIAMPGNDSLLAAVRPGQTKAFYFVARGDGSSQFSETLAAHNRAVDKYQRRR